MSAPRLLRVAATALLAPIAATAFAEELAVGKLEQYTENRGWNEAGVGPLYQMMVTACVVPSGFPTLVHAQSGSLREPLVHFATAQTPDLYVLFVRVDRIGGAPWRLVAERNGARLAPVSTPGVADPWQVPLAEDLRVTGKGAQPRLSWRLPDLDGRRIERVRVAVRGGPRVQGRFLGVLFTSEALPPGASAYTLPPGVLAPGERYVFQVMLENLEEGQLKNRSLTFSDPYTYR